MLYKEEGAFTGLKSKEVLEVKSMKAQKHWEGKLKKSPREQKNTKRYKKIENERN